MCSLVATVALCLLASTAAASDLTLNGQTSLQLPPGASLQLDLTGNPGLPALLALDLDAGPWSFKGENFPLGVTPAFSVFSIGMTDGTGLVQVSAVMPTSTVWLGMDIYLLGIIVDPADPNGFDLSNGADLVGVPETCTPAVVAACLAAGLTACTSGSPDCGPPPVDLCTPAVLAACDAAGFCACDSATGACEGSPGAAGGCCEEFEKDDCGVCLGDGTGPIGCGSGTVCGGVGDCVCDQCICPAPSFGVMCSCTELSAEYNGIYQHSFINNTPETLMVPGNPLSGEGWIKPTKIGKAIYTRLGGGVQWGFSMGVVGSTVQPNALRLWNGDGCSSCTLVGNTPIPLNVWTHIAFTWDGAIAKLYVNGVLDKVGPYTPRATNPGQLLLGLFGTNYFEGNMDDMRLWSTERTAAEILANRDKSLTGPEPGLIFSHNMQQWRPGDVSCVDWSGNNFELIHSLFVTQGVNNAPAPPVESSDACLSGCNGYGACSCGVCTCFDPTDMTYDCSDTGPL